MQLILHSYTFRDHPFEECVRRACEFGWNGIELHGVHCDWNSLDQELERCKTIAEASGIPIVCVDFSADLLNTDTDAAQASANLLGRNIEICARQGIRLMNGFTGFLTGNDPTDFAHNGSVLATDADYERVTKLLREPVRIAEECGVTLMLEIHMNTIHDTIASTKRLLDLVGSSHVLANPDPGNLFATYPPDAKPSALDAIGDRIGYFHFKNGVHKNDAIDFSVCLEDGEIDIRGHLQKLVDLGYTGPVCVEYCGEGDPVPVVERDAEFVKRCLTEITSQP
ncbi:MAG: sugar phosphate isomerase/epimerase [Candidatus Hydrogenedentes bacterium]|nr:sugar phosphate isomerase/epimerase [Candidatus Hydrogenedentota bacterium]